MSDEINLSAVSYGWHLKKSAVSGGVKLRRWIAADEGVKPSSDVEGQYEFQTRIEFSRKSDGKKAVRYLPGKIAGLAAQAIWPVWQLKREARQKGGLIPFLDANRGFSPTASAAANYELAVAVALKGDSGYERKLYLSSEAWH